MLEQVGNSVDFYFFYVASKVGKTGLVDVTVDVYRAGALIVTAAAATEVGGGLYRYTLGSGSVTVAGEYAAVAKTADATVDQKWIPSLWVIGRAGVEFLDASVSAIDVDVLDNPVPGAYVGGTAGYALGRIGTDAITIVSPLAADGTTLELVRGDDYQEDQARELTFSSDDWPDLTGATEIIMTIRRRREAFGTGSDPVLLTEQDVLASRVDGAGAQTVVFELHAAEPGLGDSWTGTTNNLVPGAATGKYDVQATLADTDIVTLVVGNVNVVEDQTRV